MKTFRTSKGTELPLMNLKGKDYLQVPHRIQWFREEHPEGMFHTEFVTIDDEQTVARAKVFIKDKKGEYVLAATGTKRETKKDFPDHTEKAETGAIGRALAMVGYGTQFAIELEEVQPDAASPRIVDSPVSVTKATPSTFRKPGAVSFT